MSATNKTRYEVQKIISDVINAGLTAYIGNTHGFGVMEFAQASFVNGNRIVLMNLIRTRRVGWQSEKFHTVSSVFKRTDHFLEEQHWQLSVLLKKSASPTITELQADDVATMLIAYFNGPGVTAFRTNGVAPLRIDADSVIVYNDNSELYQKRAVFTVKLQVPKEITTGATPLDSIMPEVRPV